MAIQLYSSSMKYKNPTTGNYVDIVGVSGEPGRGIVSAVLNDDYTLTLNYTDGTSATTSSIRGATGGKVVSVEKTSTSGLVDTYTITFEDNTTATFTVTNGEVGPAPNMSIGTVVGGMEAAATITGTAENPVLNLVLPYADISNLILVQDEQPTAPENKVWFLETAPEGIQIPTVGDLSAYATKADTVLETTLSSGRKANTTVGEGSIAFGIDVEASGMRSIAFGANTVASNAHAHAEGSFTIASGLDSHAEGNYTAAVQTNAHAEGSGVTASGNSSHAEGVGSQRPASYITSTNNSLKYTFSELYPEIVIGTQIRLPSNNKIAYITSIDKENNIVTLNSTLGDLNNERCILMTGAAIGMGSHSEGLMTIAYGTAQHAQGTANVVDTTNTYADIVGNGPIGFSGTRSNAYALDWSGNGHFAGDVYVGANADSSGGIKLVKETAIAPVETATATAAHAIGDLFMLNGKLLRATAAIAIGDTITVGTNASETKMSEALASAGTVQDVQVNGSSVVNNGVASIPNANESNSGVIWISGSVSETGLTSGTNLFGYTYLKTFTPYLSQIKSGTNAYMPITPSNQDASTFYGLAKAAGDTTQSASSNAVGTYTDSAKSAIQHMLGTDTNLADYESDTTADAAYAIGELFTLNGKLHQATAAIAIGDTLTVGTNCSVVNASEVFPHDVQVNGTSVVNNGVANVPVAGNNGLGVIRVQTGDHGLQVANNGYLQTYTASSNDIRGGTQSYRAIAPNRQHESVFYGLSKVAGVDLANETVTLGTYPATSKASIKSMLGIVDGSTSTVSVTGTTPSITAVENTRYTCGEVSTLTITPPASGICIVRFTSGTTPTVLTATGVVWPAWFDATDLEADTIYEICITDGYGAVMSWAL